MKPFNFPLKLEETKLQFNEESTRSEGPFLIELDKQNRANLFKKYGEWTFRQNVKYAVFIYKNFSKLEGKPHKLLWDQYKKMADFIQTRNFRQCKSHHHFLCQQFSTIANILTQLKTKNKKFTEHFQIQLKRIQLQSKLQDQNSNKITQNTQNKINLNSLQHKYSSIVDSFKQKTSDRYMNQKEEEWLECHRLFIEWTTKLKQLLVLQSQSRN